MAPETTPCLSPSAVEPLPPSNVPRRPQDRAFSSTPQLQRRASTFPESAACSSATRISPGGCLRGERAAGCEAACCDGRTKDSPEESWKTAWGRREAGRRNGKFQVKSPQEERRRWACLRKEGSGNCRRLACWKRRAQEDLAGNFQPDHFQLEQSPPGTRRGCRRLGH